MYYDGSSEKDFPRWVVGIRGGCLVLGMYLVNEVMFALFPAPWAVAYVPVRIAGIGIVAFIEIALCLIAPFTDAWKGRWVEAITGVLIAAGVLWLALVWHGALFIYIRRVF
jgi:hypothetical protein